MMGKRTNSIAFTSVERCVGEQKRNAPRYKFALAIGLFAIYSTSVYGNGFDRVSLPPDFLLDEGTNLKLSYLHTSPDISGVGIAGPFSGIRANDVAGSFDGYGLSFKFDLNEKFSAALKVAQSYGLRINYPAEIASIQLDFDGYTADALGRYKFNDNWSVHGGLRVQRMEETPLGSTLLGVFDLESDTDYGYILGGAFENKETYTAVGFTYYSSIDHSINTTKSPGSLDQITGRVGDTLVHTPDIYELAGRQAINPKTVLFGTYRYSEWSDANVFLSYTGREETIFPDVHSGLLGIAHMFTDDLLMSIGGLHFSGREGRSYTLSEERSGLLASAKYQFNKNAYVEAAYTYLWLEDTVNSIGVQFKDGSSETFSFEFGYRFD